jgi:hypothetical protein
VIEQRRGRARAGTAELDIDADHLGAVGDFLAVAARDCPAIRVFGRGDPGGPAVQPLFRLFGHAAGIAALGGRAGPEGGELISGSRDGTAKVWSIPDGELRLRLRASDAEAASPLPLEVTALQIAAGSSEGRRFVVTGHRGGFVRAWDLAEREPVFELAFEAAEGRPPRDAGDSHASVLCAVSAGVFGSPAKMPRLMAEFEDRVREALERGATAERASRPNLEFPGRAICTR